MFSTHNGVIKWPNKARNPLPWESTSEAGLTASVSVVGLARCLLTLQTEVAQGCVRHCTKSIALVCVFGSRGNGGGGGGGRLCDVKLRRS